MLGGNTFALRNVKANARQISSVKNKKR